jgi:hypothetical protein
MTCETIMRFWPLALFMVFGFAVGWSGYRAEKRSWNSGWCPRCTGKWKCFDMDSGGGRGYRCPSGHHAWISYPGVDREVTR